MFKWWAESPNEKSIVGPFLSIQWKFIYGCKKEINQAQWKCSSQTISVQGDSAPPTSQVGDLLIFGRSLMSTPVGCEYQAQFQFPLL